MKQRVDHIDGLRGIAVLTVVLFHAGVYNSFLAAHPDTMLSFVLRQGCHGVDLFFILSGFCLSYPALARVRAAGRSAFSISAFAARRVVRIVPPYYAAIAAFLVLGFALFTLRLPLPEPMAPDALSAGAVLKQALFLDRDGRFLDASFWTLAIEFRWYFVFPAVLWLWIRLPKVFAAIAVAAVAAGATRLNSVDLFFLPFFMLGIVAAEVYVVMPGVRRFAVAAAAISLAVAGASTAHAGWYFIEKGPFWGVAMFCLVVAAGATPAFRRVASSRWLVRAGTTSYGIYLIHEPIVALVERSVPPSAGPAAAYVLAVAAALAAGTAFSLLAERPFVSSSLRGRLVCRLEPIFRSFSQRLGMRDTIELRSTPAPTPDPAREAIPA